jgi:hypothetical protein
VRKLLFIRFTSSTPSIREDISYNDNIADICIEQPKVQYVADNMIMTPFQTELTIEECAAKLTERGYLFLLFDITKIGDNFMVNHTNGFVTNFLGLPKNSNFQIREVPPEIFDEDAIYAKLDKYGIDSLTSREKKFLQSKTNQ